MKTADFIIVGQGIAGSLLSFMLMKRGKKTIVINKTRANSSSLVAAGLFNPVTGRKMIKSWMIDELFPFMDVFYRELEQELNVNFYHPSGIYTPFFSVEEQNDWMGKSSLPDYKPHIDNLFRKGLYENVLINAFGGVGFKGGYVDVPLMLKHFRMFLERQNLYFEDDFDVEQLQIGENSVQYKGIKSKKVIFCTGIYGSEAGPFQWLPFWPVKGEVMVAEIKNLPDLLVNRGVFIIPLGNNLAKVGSTYTWDNLNEGTTEAAKIELSGKLKNLLLPDFELKEQKAGIRPTVKDRRPIIGFHPEHKLLGIFNGLGTKGVSLAPFFAAQFADVLTEVVSEKVITKDVNISRFFSLY